MVMPSALRAAKSALRPSPRSRASSRSSLARRGPTASNSHSQARALSMTEHFAIATRRGYCWWDVDHAGWVVTLSSPEEQDFYGRTLEEARAWCLVWLMAPEIG